MNTNTTLNLNKNLSNLSNGEIVDAKNIVVSKDYKAIRNEDGFDLIKF